MSKLSAARDLPKTRDSRTKFSSIGVSRTDVGIEPFLRQERVRSHEARIRRRFTVRNDRLIRSRDRLQRQCRGGLYGLSELDVEIRKRQNQIGTVFDWLRGSGLGRDYLMAPHILWVSRHLGYETP